MGGPAGRTTPGSTAERPLDPGADVPGGVQGDRDAIDDILATKRVVIVLGPGGVGKTTMSAALGLRAARAHGRRVVVVTVDPARRLAEALGVDRLTEEPILVPAGEHGRLWALMIDMAQSWDRVVHATSPDPRTASRLLDNGLYRTLTRRFIQSHDYIALDHLLSLDEGLAHDLVVVDTPPSRHAIDLIDAPARMIDFFDSRLLRWLTVGAGPGLGGLAARPFLTLAERLLGGRFLGEIVEFFTLFAALRPAFVTRSRQVQARLDADDTSYLAVTTAEHPVVDACQDLIDGLAERDQSPQGLIVNRVLPGLRLVGGPGPRRLELVDELTGLEPIDQLEDPSLADAVAGLVDRARASSLPEAADAVPTVTIPASGGDITSVAGLGRLLGQ